MMNAQDGERICRLGKALRERGARWKIDVEAEEAKSCGRDG